MVEGDSGILAVHPPEYRPQYEPSKRRLTWPNGGQALLFNASEPDQLRGPQHEAAWCDELAKWRYAQDTWDMLQFGLRLGERPQQVITTTPRPIKLMKDLIKQNDAITRGSTLDNSRNLAQVVPRPDNVPLSRARGSGGRS
jgi:phage terminase large subunit-like protein